MLPGDGSQIYYANKWTMQQFTVSTRLIFSLVVFFNIQSPPWDQGYIEPVNVSKSNTVSTNYLNKRAETMQSPLVLVHCVSVVSALKEGMGEVGVLSS